MDNAQRRLSLDAGSFATALVGIDLAAEGLSGPLPSEAGFKVRDIGVGSAFTPRV